MPIGFSNVPLGPSLMISAFLSSKTKTAAHR
jgi:hypothetical protein